MSLAGSSGLSAEASAGAVYYRDIRLLDEVPDDIRFRDDVLGDIRYRDVAWHRAAFAAF